MKLFGYLPGGGGLHHFSPTRLFLDRDSRTAIVLNPKVGSTFLRDALARAFVEQRGLKDPSNGRYRVLSMARRFPVAPLGDYWQALRSPETYSFYALARNPYARLKSAWKDKFYNGHHQGYARSMRDGELAKMRRFARARGLPGGQGGELVPFETFIADVLAGEIGRMNHHWDAQYQVLMMDRFRYERLFHIETEQAEALDLLGKRLGFADGWAVGGKRNASDQSELTVFDQSVADKVYHRFEQDFRTLNYARDSWQGL